jgi:hypothetical protein
MASAKRLIASSAFGPMICATRRQFGPLLDQDLERRRVFLHTPSRIPSADIGLIHMEREVLAASLVLGQADRGQSRNGEYHAGNTFVVGRPVRTALAKHVFDNDIGIEFR